jgi:hypothetical protein
MNGGRKALALAAAFTVGSLRWQQVSAPQENAEPATRAAPPV